MPEGPQARRMANIITKFCNKDICQISHLSNKTTWDIDIPAKITSVCVHGKNIFIHLNNGKIIYNHMLMWGWWFPTLEPKTKKRLNTAFLFADGTSLGYFGGGIIKPIDQKQLFEIKDKLGPDIIDSPNAEIAFKKLSKSNLAIGPGLLEQSLIAGVGNIYKNEALFVAKINPTQIANTLTSNQYQKLFNFLQPQMKADIYRSGKINTISKQAAKNGHYNFVYKRLGQNCLFCNSKIQRIYQGSSKQRSTYFCPLCQRL